MTSQDAIETRILDNINARIRQLGTDGKHVATRAGMVPRTYYRSIAGGRSFTVAELERIAAALEVELSDLLRESPSFLAREAA